MKSHIFQTRVLYCLVVLALVAGCATGTQKRSNEHSAKESSEEEPSRTAREQGLNFAAKSGSRDAPSVFPSRRAQSFRHPDADLSAITRVAVIPFDNYTGTQFAAEKVTTIYITALLMDIDVDVVEPGEVSRVLRESNITGGKLSQDDVRKIGNSLKADTLIFGTVLEYGQERVRNETYPVVSVNVRWVDVNTGTIIFMGTASDEGSPKVPVVDVGQEQLFSVLTQRVCHKLITMVR
ncbi:hypothetical protein HZA56_17625 [Candidatus Poribacteria bacterium]|nr:hypothetical protein [Candidatus Poribacteria bacterium]